jgi:hypothetical protein
VLKKFKLFRLLGPERLRPLLNMVLRFKDWVDLASPMLGKHHIQGGVTHLEMGTVLVVEE